MMMMTLIKLVGTILGAWLIAVGALITFVQLVSWMGYTHDAVVNWRPAPIDMFYSDAFLPFTGILVIVIFLLSVYIIELRKKLQQ